MKLYHVVIASIMILLGSYPLSAATRNVDLANPSCNDSACAPCCTIQGAVYQSSGGDVISVAPGTYPEQVDFRDMWSVGDITLEAASGPGTVLVSAPSGHTLRHGGGYINTVTIDGVDFSSAPTYSCVYLNHLGGAVLHDVTIDGCGYTAFILDNPGSVTMERCSATNSARNGIQIDGASGATVTDCIASSNVDVGFRVFIPAGTLLINNPVASGNGGEGFGIEGHVMVLLDGGSAVDNGGNGIWIDTSSAAILENFTVTGNTEDGIDVNWYNSDYVDSVHLTANTVDGNGGVDSGHGINIMNSAGHVVIDGCNVTDSGRAGISIETEGTVEITNTTATGNYYQGFDIQWNGANPSAGVILTGVEASNNGFGWYESGVRLREIEGPVVVTNGIFDNNNHVGFSVETSVVGNLEISGGRANGNAAHGYDLQMVGNVTVTGATASSNTGKGFSVDGQATVAFENCVANDNSNDSGFSIDWQEPEPLDSVSILDCTSNRNGLLGGGEGINIRHIDGPVTVTGCSASGNFYSGVRIRDAFDSVFIRDVTATANLEEGIEMDVDADVTMIDNLIADNLSHGLDINSSDLGVSSVTIKRNTFTGNQGTGVALLDLASAGAFKVTCNDIAGNSSGMYLDAPVTLDAEHIWWGDPTGPSGQGSGAGDPIYAEPVGTIDYDPWLAESFAAPNSGCPIFEADFETGTLAEWDLAVD